MTDKTKMSNLESYTELSIQIATIDMKLDAILKLLNKPEIVIDDIKVSIQDPIHVGEGGSANSSRSHQHEWEWRNL